ncbi:MAG: polysaccharide biosynthesis tyrosine autokinase [Nitrospirota bacterium]
MSKRELALEEAVKLRKTKAVVPKPFTGGAVRQDATHRFAPGEPAVDPLGVATHIVCIKEPDSFIAEQYKRIRARILRSPAKEIPTTIMITSPDTGEGKTVTAVNLAVTMAKEIDHTVLLVDADLRNPSIHKYLGIKPRCGLGDYLTGSVALSDALIKTGIGKLTVLPAGNPPENPAELLASGRMRTLIQEMKQRYRDRFVLFDLPPILTTAEPLSLGNCVDGVIMVTQAARTSPKAAAKALSLMKGFNILGVVFNSVPPYLSASTYPYRPYPYTRQKGGADSPKKAGNGKS